MASKNRRAQNRGPLQRNASPAVRQSPSQVQTRPSQAPPMPATPAAEKAVHAVSSADEIRRAVEEKIRGELTEAIQKDETAIRADYRQREEAQLLAQIEKAEADAEAIRAEAQSAADDIVASAHADAESVRNAARTEASEELSKQRQGLEEIEHQLRSLEIELQKRSKSLRRQEEDIALELEEITGEKARLKGRWEQCSPGRVRELENELNLLAQYREADALIADKLREENAQLRAQIGASGGRSADNLLGELESEREQTRYLRDQLANYPRLEVIEVLRSDAESLVKLREEYATLRSKLTEVEGRAARLEIGNREVEQTRVQAEALRALNNELRKELQQFKETLEGRSGERFPELVRIDSRQRQSEAPLLQNKLIRFQALADHVCDYAASRTPALYYSRTAIRAFIAGLASSRLSILQGLSGTGKTSLPRVFADAIAGRYVSIPVQSGWRDRHELLGYNNDFSKRFSESEFTKAVYQAGLPENRETLWFLVLDEMNLARIEYYFADFLSVLEEPKHENWYVPLMSYDPRNGSDSGPQYLQDGYKLRVPENLWFVGTANQDESTFEITDKVYDRAQVITFRRRQEEFQVDQPLEVAPVSLHALERSFKKAVEQGKGRLIDDDWAFVERVDNFLQEHCGITFGNRIKAQLERFVPVFVECGGLKSEAVDFQLVQKVLRKVENLHDPAISTALKDLRDLLTNDKPSGWGPLNLSQELIERQVAHASVLR